MLVTYLRSSSIGAYEWCPHSHWIGSNLGVPRAAGTAATVGSAVHKALELLAKQKQVWAAGESLVTDGELRRSFSPAASEWEFLDAALDFYAQKADWDADARERAAAWLAFTLSCNGGAYDPRNLDVVAPELYFDLEIREAWSWYDYLLPGGGRLQGHLRIKGTMDLLVRERPGLLHYVDWKTGARMNWTTRRPKEADDLRKDPQFLMYYYALRRLFPDDQVFFTVFYTQAGGPYSICFDDGDIHKALAMLRHHFNLIRGDARPTLAKDNARQSWKCSRCSYQADQFADSGQSTCTYFANQLVQLGMDGVFARHGNLDAVQKYADGGGASARE